MGDGQNGNSSNGDGSSSSEPDASDLHETLADLLDGHDLGALLMGQLEDLIDSWAKVIEVVTEHGVDPTPLLQTLAHTLRATADQLDPSGRAAT
jgi:hypothetical protein